MSSNYRPYFGRERDRESGWDRRREQRRGYGFSYADDDYERGERDFRDREFRDRDFGDRDLFDPDDRRRERGSGRGRLDEFEDWERPRELGSSSFGRLRPVGSAFGRSGPFGRYAGRGPKGYQRSDDRIREEICDRLTEDGEVDASEIEVSVQNGEVTLEGAVLDRQMKRDAEDCAERVSGVREVNNRLRVATAPAMQRREAPPVREGEGDERDNMSGVSRFWRGGH